jgi:hypothetical protein
MRALFDQERNHAHAGGDAQRDQQEQLGIQRQGLSRSFNPELVQ